MASNRSPVSAPDFFFGGGGGGFDFDLSCIGWADGSSCQGVPSSYAPPPFLEKFCSGTKRERFDHVLPDEKGLMSAEALFEVAAVTDESLKGSYAILLKDPTNLTSQTVWPLVPDSKLCVVS